MSTTTEIVYTHHAKATMERRKVSKQEVVECIHYFDFKYYSPTHRGRDTPNAYVYQKGPLAVVVAEEPEARVVVTVLLRSTQPWTDAQAALRHAQDQG